MDRELFSDLLILKAVADEGTFTRAATRVRTSQSQISLVIRRLEKRLGAKMVARTTRNCAITPEGIRILEAMTPALAAVDQTIRQVSDAAGRPTGHLRLAAVEHAAPLIWPTLSSFAKRYPDIEIELTLDYGFRDLVADRYDAGIKLGSNIEQDMIAVRIGPDLGNAVVASPAYLDKHPAPSHPRELLSHRCLNLWLASNDQPYRWQFARDGQSMSLAVKGQLTFNSIDMLRKAVLAGHGLAYLPIDIIKDDIQEGQLLPVLEEWCEPLPGYFLFYPDRHQRSYPLTLFIEALQRRHST